MSGGWIPDPPKAPAETPDRLLGSLRLSSVFPRATSLRHLVLSVLDQGGIESCVANAVAQAIRISQVRIALGRATTGDEVERALSIPLGSRLFAYWFARSYHGAQDVDIGTHLRSCFAAVQKFGIPPEAIWPYSDSRAPAVLVGGVGGEWVPASGAASAPFARMPGGNAIRLAFDQHAPTTYNRIDDPGYDRVDAMKRAISSGYAVAFGTVIGRGFRDNAFDASTPLDPPPASEAVGGHAMVAIGYDGDAFEIVNSWGTGWGAEGYALLSSEYLAWEETRDLWVVERAPFFSSSPRV